MRRRLAPLRVRPFDRLLVSYTVNDIGDVMGVVALSILVFDRTHSAVPTAGFFVAAKFLPAMLAPLLVARVDQLALRRILPAIYVLEGIVFGGLALIASQRFLLVAVLALGCIDGCLALTARSLTRGAVATVLQPAALLREGNALMNVGFAVSSVAGAALAGVLITEIGLGAALAADAATFVLIAALLAATRNLPQVSLEGEPWGERLRAGLRFARESGPVRALLAGQALGMLCFTLVTPIEVIYVKRTLGGTSAGFGALLASWGAGIVIGSLLYAWLRQRSALGLILSSSAAIGLAYLGMATADELVVACALSVLGGAGNGIQWIAVVTALQEATPAELQARVSGLLESIGAAMPGLGYIVGGAIVALASPRAAFAAAGAGVMVLVLLGWAARSRLTFAREPHKRPSTAPM